MVKADYPAFQEMLFAFHKGALEDNLALKIKVFIACFNLKDVVPIRVNLAALSDGKIEIDIIIKAVKVHKTPEKQKGRPKTPFYWCPWPPF
jgi:hypothetical protein